MSTHRSASAFVDRRTVIASAVVLVAALVFGIVLVIVTYDPQPEVSTSTTVAGAEVAAPRSIPRPEDGKGPEDAGDPGGWAQLALLGVIVVVIAGIGVYVVRGGGAKARAGRDAWKAAAASGEDGVLEARSTSDETPANDPSDAVPHA